jgi:bacteriocin biosynthesis cyclodehydratase domain-containing protein
MESASPVLNLRKPLVRHGVRLLRRSSGDAYVVTPRRFKVVKGFSGDALSSVFRLLDGTLTVPEIVAEAAATDRGLTEGQCACILTALSQEGILIEGEVDLPAVLTMRDLDRHDRQIQYWAGFEAEQPGRTRYDFQSALKESSVGLIGIGGLGSPTAVILAATGVGRVVVADPDVVEMSNLNRQIVFTEADIGRPKVDAARENLLRLNSDLVFEGHHLAIDSVDSALEFIEGLDFVAITSDHPPDRLRRWVAEACAIRHVPYAVWGAVVLGPIVVPGATPCFGCYEARLRELDPDYESFVEQVAAAPPVLASPAFFGSIAGGLLARDIILLLAGAGTPLARGRIVRLDLEAGRLDAMPLEWREDCPFCGRDSALREERGEEPT